MDVPQFNHSPVKEHFVHNIVNQLYSNKIKIFFLKGTLCAPTLYSLAINEIAYFTWCPECCFIITITKFLNPSGMAAIIISISKTGKIEAYRKWFSHDHMLLNGKEELGTQDSGALSTTPGFLRPWRRLLGRGCRQNQKRDVGGRKSTGAAWVTSGPHS